MPRRYGFGVGGEYPMAASSAAERAESSLSKRSLRGREVILTFSGQVGRGRQCAFMALR